MQPKKAHFRPWALKKYQTAYKPGSVPVEAVAGIDDGWPFIWDARYRTPRATNPGNGAKTRVDPACTEPVLPLFDLAPGGVYPAAFVTEVAVRSYRTLSPLPVVGRNRLERAVCFLWHFP